MTSVAMFFLAASALATVETRAIHGSSGAISMTGTEERYLAGTIVPDEPPAYPGAEYLGGKLLRELKQGHVVVHDATHGVFLVHDYVCALRYIGAESPFTCDSTVFILRPATAEEGGGYAEAGRVKGNADSVVMHPTLPIFATERAGCCDGPALTAIYDVSGKTLCPETEVYGAGPFDKIDVNVLTCPGKKAGGRKAKIANWATLLPATAAKKK